MLLEGGAVHSSKSTWKYHQSTGHRGENRLDEAIGKYLVYNDSIEEVESLKASLLSFNGSVYEIVKVIERTPLFLRDHLERLNNSAALAVLKGKVSPEKMETLIGDLIERCRLSSGNIKILYRKQPGTQKGETIIHFIKVRHTDPVMYREGIRAGIYRGERGSPHIKRNDSRIRGVVGAILRESDFFEILLENNDGYISEGSRSNIFFIKQSTLFTPPLEYVLPGITRKKVIEIADNINIEFHEQSVHRREIDGFEAIFLTGTSIKILPVLSVEDSHFDTNHPFLRSLMESYDQCIELYIKTELKVRS